MAELLELTHGPLSQSSGERGCAVGYMLIISNRRRLKLVRLLHCSSADIKALFGALYCLLNLSLLCCGLA